MRRAAMGHPPSPTEAVSSEWRSQGVGATPGWRSHRSTSILPSGRLKSISQGSVLIGSSVYVPNLERAIMPGRCSLIQ